METDGPVLGSSRKLGRGRIDSELRDKLGSVDDVEVDTPDKRVEDAIRELHEDLVAYRGGVDPMIIMPDWLVDRVKYVNYPTELPREVERAIVTHVIESFQMRVELADDFRRLVERRYQRTRLSMLGATVANLAALTYTLVANVF